MTLTVAALAAGCGGSDAGTRPDRASTAEASPAATVTAAAPAATTVPAPTTPATTTPPTPEEKINTIAADHGWTLDDPAAEDDDSYDDPYDADSLYATPADFVQDMCDSLPDQAANGPAQWLAEGQATSSGQMNILKTGIPLLCPEWTKTVKQAVSGHYPVYIGSGTYKVTSKRADDTVPPGTYRTTGDLEGCYWERTRANGDIIDNNFATAATKITVTILPSDDLFTSQECGTWKPVG
ncbi:hypothetical protein ABZX65_26865 [Streptomyces sp. NPDC003300]|uniref:hypothetical protein n=1 Tax=unclassified Streptomyces TaxID=2593676 RepID=UPI0033BA9890